MIYLRGWGLGRKRERGREGGSSTVFVIALEKKISVLSLFLHIHYMEDKRIRSWHNKAKRNVFRG